MTCSVGQIPGRTQGYCSVAIRIWGTALTNFLWVFFGRPSGGDDRKRIFTERAGREGGSTRGGWARCRSGGGSHKFNANCRQGREIDECNGQTTTQHVEFMNGPTTVGLALMRINSQQEGGRGRARAKRMRIGRMCNKMDL